MNTDRRRFLGLLAGVAAGGAGASAFARTGRADARATFVASDVTVRTHDGALDAVTVAPAGTVSWSGLEESAGSVALALHAKLDSALQYHELASRRLDAAGLHGGTDYQFETHNLLHESGFSARDFGPGDGETLTRQVRLRLAVTVYATDDETVLTTGYADATFDVTVENRPEKGTVDGRANTGAEAEDGTTETETTEDGTTTEEATTTEDGTTEDAGDEASDGNGNEGRGSKNEGHGRSNEARSAGTTAEE